MAVGSAGFTQSNDNVKQRKVMKMNALYAMPQQEHGLPFDKAKEVARRLGPKFLAARGNTGWFAIDSSSPMWHDLPDHQLARLGLRRSELAPRRPKAWEVPA